jgi:hypothetical protein
MVLGLPRRRLRVVVYDQSSKPCTYIHSNTKRIKIVSDILDNPIKQALIVGTVIIEKERKWAQNGGGGTIGRGREVEKKKKQRFRTYYIGINSFICKIV